MSLKDGSADNVIDNASCLSVVLPVEGIFQGSLFEVKTAADISVLQEAFNKNPYQQNLFVPNFPLHVITSDYTEVAVSSQQELKALAQDCVENGADDDNECVDLAYPVKIFTYNELNQLAATYEVANDEELYQVLSALGANDVAGFTFPIVVYTSAGSISIANNQSLQEVLETNGSTCDEDDRQYFPDLPLATQKLVLKLTDAPFPVSLIGEANITITKIEVKTGAGNDSIPFVTLLDEPVTFNLLELTNGVTASLSETELPVGSYDFFRAFVSEASLKLKNGEVFDVKVPSGSSSGIKIVARDPIVITEEAPAEYLLDFDVSRSFVLQGNPNTPAGIKGFLFKPVIRAANLLSAGSLSGVVSAATGDKLKGVQLSVFAADTLHTTGFSNADGKFSFPGLSPGSYEVQGELDGFEPSETVDVTIEKGKETTINLILTES